MNVSHQSELKSILGCSCKYGRNPLLVDVGPRCLVVQQENIEQVLNATPDLQQAKCHAIANGYTGVIVFDRYTTASNTSLEVRAFAPAQGVNYALGHLSLGHLR